MSELLTFKNQLDRIERKINAGKAKQWVTEKWISEVTGWDHEKIRQAREDGIVNYKVKNSFTRIRKGKEETAHKYEYDLNSINPLFVKRTA